MADYSAWQDLLDTYQSMHPLLQALWLLVPNLTVFATAALYFRYRLIARRENREAAAQLIEPLFRAENGKGRMVAYRSPAPDAPVLLAYLPDVPDEDAPGRR